MEENNKKMKVLQICHKPPLPPIDGGCIAIKNISSGLINQLESIKILTISTLKHPFNKKYYSKTFLEKTQIEHVFVDTSLNKVDAFSNLVTYDSYNISRFFSPDFDQLIINTLKTYSFDIIILESLFTTPYISTIRTYSTAKIILRSHNLEHVIWERLAKESINPAKKIYLKLLSSQLKTYEINTLKDIDGIAAISNEDKKKYLELGCEKPIVTIPFGIDIQSYKPTKKEKGKPIQFFHLGAMDWKPNLEGISWLINEIWPIIKNEIPHSELHIAGKNMPKWLLNDSLDGITNHQHVDDAKEFMNEYDIMLVPLLSAGGVRVKIIEGMALEKAIISTTIGAEGLDFSNNKHLLIANTPNEFCQKAMQLAMNPSKIESIGKDAREHVFMKYDNQIIITELIELFDSIK